MTRLIKHPKAKDDKSKSNKTVNKEKKKKRIFKKSTRKRIKSHNVSSHSKFLVNPSISHFNIESKFIYDLDAANEFFNEINNKNLLKVNNKELNYLIKEIERIDLTKEILNETSFISIPKENYEKLQNIINRKELDDPLTNFIKKKLSNIEERPFLSCRKLSELYFLETGVKTNRTTVNNIINKKLGYHYLKTVAKKSIIKSEENLICSFAFIKIIIKCIIMNFKLIFVDESQIRNNNNFPYIRKSNEQIYF